MKRALPVLAVLLLAPWVGEFLLGNISVRQLPALLILALLYGCGALSIREVAGMPLPARNWSPTTRKPPRSAWLVTTFRQDVPSGFGRARKGTQAPPAE